ncbi:MFS transporter [Fluctibacter corallii]|uniref:MFS transporter n=1 Tax=Fluctibacter corallii TaxID=2984329 RepID=UPI00384F8F22
MLAITYFLYFGQLGVLVPYLGVFLDGRGFSSAEIGELFAIITIARILGPNLWASMADKSGKGLNVLRFGCLLTACTFCLVFFFDGFWGITVPFALMMMFWTAVLPQLEVLTMNTVNSNATKYSQIRLWGSIGFICLTIVAGQSIDVFSSEAPVVVSAVVLSALFLSTLTLKEPKVERPNAQELGSIWREAKSPVFFAFIVSALLLQVSFGTYYGFFALYMLDLGYSGQQTGWLVALGVAAEVVIFLLAGRLISIMGVKWVLVASLLLTAIRWLALAHYPDSVVIVVLSQVLHAFSFGLTHAASVHFIHHFFSKQFHSRGQALYVSLAFGVGGAIGNYSAGLMWQDGKGAYLSFMVSFAAACLSALVLLCISRQSMEQRASAC